MPIISSAARSLALSCVIASCAFRGEGGGVATVAADMLSSVAVSSHPASSSSSLLLQSASAAALLQSAQVVGAAWVISSAVLTTYSTTLFLKYPREKDQDRFSRLPTIASSASSSASSLPPTKKNPLTDGARFLPSLSSKVSRQTTSFLQAVPRATLLTLFRFAGSLLLGLFLHLDVGQIGSRIAETRQWVPSFAVPAVLLFVANYSNSVSLNRIGISLTYTSKCGIPLMTVLLTLLLDGRAALPGPLALVSLVPIATGIALASWSAPTFETAGFVAALLSTTAQSALNVSSKRVMAKTLVSGPVAQRCMVAIGLALTLVVSLGQELVRRYVPAPSIHKSHLKADRVEKGHQQSTAAAAAPPRLPPAWLAVLAFASYHLEYVLSFTFVRLVPPVTYGTLDAVRRLGIILTGRAMFGGAPLTATNKAGIALALLGALSYSVVTSR
jgi:Triose-phosphate Transporter family